GSAAFSVVGLPSIPAAVSAGGSVSFGVRCNPATDGEKIGTLVVATDVPGSAVLTAPLRCVAGAALIVSPSSLDFGAVPANEEKTLAITITNGGASTLSIGGVESDVVSFVVGDPQATSLNPGESLQVSVAFRPLAATTYAGIISVNDPDGVALQTIDVTGVSGKAIAIVAASDPLDFGIVGVGGAINRSVLVVNVGSEAVQIGGPTVTGSAFSSSTSFSDVGTLPVGGSLEIALRFTPVALGSYSGTVAVVGVNPGGAQLEASVDLVGRSGGFLEIRPTDLAFGEVPVGSNGSQTITLRNLSPNNEINVHRLQAGDVDEFSALPAPTALTIAPLKSQTITVTFAPGTTGDFTSVLTFYTDEGVEGGSADVTLTGRSGSHAGLLTPVSGFIGFPGVEVGSDRLRPLRIGAIGNSQLEILGFGFADDEMPFELVGVGTPPLLIEGGSVAELEVRCAPTAAGIYETTLTIATSDPIQPTVSVDLWCSTPSRVTANPTDLDFGALAPFASRIEVVTLDNKGASVAQITSAMIIANAQDAFALSEEVTSGQPIVASGEFQVGVRFSPPAGGSFTATLMVTTTDPATPQIFIPLTGHAGPHLEVTPPVATFCKGAGSETLKVRNNGTETLELSAGDFANAAPLGATVTLLAGGVPQAFPVVLAVDDEIDLRIAFNGVVPPGTQVDGAEYVISSSDPSRPNLGVRIVMGAGLVIPTGFSGAMDIGSPGEPAFNAGGLGTTLEELCTGGVVAGNGESLFYAYPAADGGATVLGAWGDALGETDLGTLAAQAGTTLSGSTSDLGAVLAKIGDTGLVAVASPSAGMFVLVAANGSIATWHPSGGVIDLRAKGFKDVAIGDVGPRGTGFVVADQIGRRLIGLTETGEVDLAFGTLGVIDLSTFGIVDGAITVPVSRAVGDSVFVLSSGSIATSDPTAGRIYVVKPDGTHDISFGSANGIVDLGGDVAGGFGEAIHAMGVVDRFGQGFIIVDRARGRVAYALPSGAPDNTVGIGGLAQVTGGGATHPFAAVLGRGGFVTTQAASGPGTADKKVFVFESSLGDALVLSEKGLMETEGLAAFKASPCPIVISGISSTGSGTSNAITLSNIGNGPALDLHLVELPTDLQVSCGPGQAWSCDGGGTLINAAGPESTTLAWNPDGATGCFETEVVFHHRTSGGEPSANGPTTTCPLRLETLPQPTLIPAGAAAQGAYAFPPLALGASYEKEFIVLNTGCGEMSVNEVFLSKDFDPNFELKTAVGGSVLGTPLRTGEFHRLSVTCKPAVDGGHTNTLQFILGGTAVNLQATVSCDAGPRLESSHTELNWFGIVPGQQLIREFTLTNTGGAPATVTLASGLPGTLAPVVAFPGTIPPGNTAQQLLTAFEILPSGFQPVIPVGATRTIRIAFTPPWSAEFSTTLSMVTNSYLPFGGVIEVALNGRASPCPVFTPEPVDFVQEFGPIVLGASQTIEVDVINAGGDILSMDTLAASLDGTVFSVVDASLNLPPGAEGKISVTCTPTTAERFEATLNLEAAGACNAVDDIVGLKLICEGGNCPELTNSVDGNLDVDFGDMQWDDEPPTETFDLVNDSDAPLTIALDVDNSQLLVDGALEREIAANSTETIAIALVPDQLEREI
ncbi:MAG: hypothetical protein ACI9OJ_003678, partial [Myxococcota bacterium]